MEVSAPGDVLRATISEYAINPRTTNKQLQTDAIKRNHNGLAHDSGRNPRKKKGPDLFMTVMQRKQDPTTNYCCLWAEKVCM